MKVTINNKCYIEIDSYNNHTPFLYSEGGELITVGKLKGQASQPKWVSSLKYFSNMPNAIRYALEQDAFSNDEEITLKEYVSRMENIKAEVIEIMRSLEDI